MSLIEFSSYKLLIITLIIFTSACNSKSAEKQAGSTNEARNHPAYVRLQAALKIYEKISEDGGWEKISSKQVVNRGESSEIVPEVRKRLAVTGDLPASEAKSDSKVYDKELQRAVEKFQSRHAIYEDGVIGPNTVREMNVTVDQRISQIKYSIGVWEQFSTDLGEKHILVNVPEFRLRTYRNNEVDLNMRIVVGKEYGGQTPSFSDSVEYVIFNPYWNIPESIVENEIMPHAKKDPSYLHRKNYEIVSHFSPDAQVFQANQNNLDRVENGDLHIRQKPGPNNALGLIKFMFPNKYKIYLHGTPADHLFEKVDRTFSHGCIRVEDPVALGEFILENAENNWRRQDIETVMNTTEWKQVNLKEKIPVFIVYMPAFVEDDGRVVFSKDIYNRM